MEKPNNDEIQGFSSNEYLPTEHKKYQSEIALELWKKLRWRVKSKVMYAKMTENLTPIMRSVKISRKSLVKIKISMPLFMLHPESNVKLTWNCVLIVLLIYTATITPVRVCFMDNIIFSTWWWADTVVDILFFIDVIINLNSAYFNDEMDLVTDRKMIFYRYLRTWMMLDICACTPFSVILGDNSANSQGKNNFIKLIRLFRLYRLFKILKLIKSMRKLAQNDESLKLKEAFSLSTTSVYLIEFFIKTLIAIHVISCFWYFSAKINNFRYDTWVVFFGFEDLSLGDLYLRSFYWAFTTLTTVGYGDIHPVNNTEILIVLVWMLFGLCFFSYTLGVLSSMLLSKNTKEIALNNKLLIIDEFIKEENLTRELSTSIKEAIKYSNEKTGFSWADKQNIFNELPAELRYEVALKMHSGCIANIPFFMTKDKIFISSIVPFLQNINEKRSEYVYEKGDHACDIYFLVTGKILIMCGDVVIKKLKCGKYFGEIEPLLGQNRKFSAYVPINSELLVMNKDLIEFIQEEFPNYFKEMVLRANIKKKQLSAISKKVKVFILLKKENEFHNKSPEKIKEIIENTLKIKSDSARNSISRSNYGKIVDLAAKLNSELNETEVKLINTYQRTEKILLR